MTGARGKAIMAPMRFRRLALALATAVLASATFVAGAFQAPPPAAPLPLRIIVSSTRQDAERLLARVRRGEDFAAIALAESIDPSAAVGRALGVLDGSTLRP